MIPVKPQYCAWCFGTDDHEPILCGTEQVTQVKCPGCGLHGPGEHVTEYLDDDDELSEEAEARMDNRAIRKWNRLQDLIGAGKLVME
jgi:hypothetical protein